MTIATKCASTVASKRKKLALSTEEFSVLIGLGKQRSLLIEKWERGEMQPTAKWLRVLDSLPDNIPFRRDTSAGTEFTFIDLFAGIGGMRFPFQQRGGECVFSSEWDKFSQQTYVANYGDLPHGDITKIAGDSVPKHDLLLAGFPCQAFSQAGLKKGFLDTRGTMFFEIQRILALRRPRAFLLENVKQLRGHDNGETLKTILRILCGEQEGEIPNTLPLSDEVREALSVKLNYCVDYRVLRAADFGVPQNRERLYIVGFEREFFNDLPFEEIFAWPKGKRRPTTLGSILEDSRHLPAKYTISQRLWNGHRRRKQEHRSKGNGFGYSLFTSSSKYVNTISARYYKDGSEILIDQSELDKLPRKLTPRECARLQGFSDKFIVDLVSDAQAYRQFGNSVAVPVIDALAKEMVKSLSFYDSEAAAAIRAEQDKTQLELKFAQA